AWSFASPAGRAVAPQGSAWVSAKDPAHAARLSQAIFRLARSLGFLMMESPIDEGFPYRLELVHAATQEPVDRTTKLGARYGFVLRADPRQMKQDSIAPRFLYLFSIDAEGERHLIYPSRKVAAESRRPLK